MSEIAVTTPRRVVLAASLALVCAIVISAVGNTVVSLLARAAGASSDFRPLQPATYIGLTVVGLVAGLLGWLVVRRTAHPTSTMRRLVPLVVLVSWVPDVLLGISGFQPHTTWTGVVGLMAMHLVVAGVAVVTFSRLLPLPADR